MASTWALRAVLRRYVPDLPADALGVLTSGSEGVLSAEAGRRIARGHGIEEVGERLRAMMPWLKANRLVDQSKN